MLSSITSEPLGDTGKTIESLLPPAIILYHLRSTKKRAHLNNVRHVAAGPPQKQGPAISPNPCLGWKAIQINYELFSLVYCVEFSKPGRLLCFSIFHTHTSATQIHFYCPLGGIFLEHPCSLLSCMSLRVFHCEVKSQQPRVDRTATHMSTKVCSAKHARTHRQKKAFWEVHPIATCLRAHTQAQTQSDSDTFNNPESDGCGGIWQALLSYTAGLGDYSDSRLLPVFLLSLWSKL